MHVIICNFLPYISFQNFLLVQHILRMLCPWGRFSRYVDEEYTRIIIISFGQRDGGDTLSKTDNIIRDEDENQEKRYQI